MGSTSSSSDPVASAEPAWQRNRRLRLAEIEAADEHGRQLVERYDHGQSRERFAVRGHERAKARWRR